MIDERMYNLGNEPSAIRELFAYGLKRKAEIGDDKVFDYSIGNPSVPAPQKVADTIEELMKLPPVELHAYSPAAGIPAVRQTIADSIARRYGIPAKAGRVYMTVGAAASIAISLGAVTNAGDEVIVPSPYFPEYKVWIETMGCSIVEVPTQVPSFQLDVEAMGAAINEKTAAVIINSPNNPVGAVYTRENLEALAAMLEEKGKEIGHPIYLISDEPYREITYGVEVPYVPTIYPRTLVCYSYSKALSLPGERVGYVYVSDTMDAEEADRVFFAVAGAGRAHGYICAPVLFQRVAAACVDEPSDVEAYATNRRILTEALDEMGYEYVQPDGAFYLWVRALEPDAQAFSDRAKQHELLIVPSDSFGCPGWVRMSYCFFAFGRGLRIVCGVGAFPRRLRALAASGVAGGICESFAMPAYAHAFASALAAAGTSSVGMLSLRRMKRAGEVSLAVFACGSVPVGAPLNEAVPAKLDSGAMRMPAASAAVASSRSPRSLSNCMMKCKPSLRPANAMRSPKASCRALTRASCVLRAWVRRRFTWRS